MQSPCLFSPRFSQALSPKPCWLSSSVEPVTVADPPHVGSCVHSSAIHVAYMVHVRRPLPPTRQGARWVRVCLRHKASSCAWPAPFKSTAGDYLLLGTPVQFWSSVGNQMRPTTICCLRTPPTVGGVDGGGAKAGVAPTGGSATSVFDTASLSCMRRRRAFKALTFVFTESFRVIKGFHLSAPTTK